MANAYSIPEDPRRAADEAEALVYAVARQDEKEEVVSRPRRSSTRACVQLEHIQQRDRRSPASRPGSSDLDELLSGLQRGNLIIVAARPGVGQVVVRHEPGPERRRGRRDARRDAPS